MGFQAGRQVVLFEVVRRKRIVGRAQAILQGQIKRGGGFADTRDADQDQVGLVEAFGIEAVVQIECKVDGIHTRFIVGCLTVGVAAAGGGSLAERRFDSRRNQVEYVE